MRSLMKEKPSWLVEYVEKYGYPPPVSGGANEDPDESDDDDDTDDDLPKGGTLNKDGVRTYTQSEVDAAIRSRLKREGKVIENRVEKRLTEKLATAQAEKDKDLQAQLDLLKPKADRTEKLEEALELFVETAEARFTAELAKLPEAIRLLAPDEDADTLEKERWLVEKAQPAADKLRAKRKKSGESDDDDDEDSDEPDDKNRQAKRGANFQDPSQKKSNKKNVDKILDRMKGESRYKVM